MTINQLAEVLVPHVGLGKNVVDIKSTNLVGPGENYGGELFKLDITVQDEQTKENEVLHAVGKAIPPNEHLQQIFDVQKTFKAEMLFYEKLVPAFQKFQREHNVKEVIDCFPKFYGGRSNTNGSDVVDGEAVIIMENLIESGYRNLDRHVGYNLEEVKIVLKDLAALHAVPLAIKIKQPDFFEKEIKPLCSNKLNLPEDDPLKKAILVYEEILWNSDDSAPVVPKVVKLWHKYHSSVFDYVPREPFATFSHCDLWVNNAMMKFENGKPVKNKFVDFQLYNYKSPGMDLLNFLLTSVATDVLQDHFEDLLVYYHAEFVSNLKQLGCDIAPFAYDKFLEDLALDSPAVFVWALNFIATVVFGRKNHSTNFAELNFDDRVVRETMIKNIPAPALDRINLMVKEYRRRRWL